MDRISSKWADKPDTHAEGDGARVLLRDLASHLRRNRRRLRDEWATRIRDARLLTAMSWKEILSEASAVYDNYIEVLETGSATALRAYARDLSRRIIPRGVETHEILGIVLLLRDVLARSLFKRYHHDFALLNRVLDAYEPAANRIANTVGASFVAQRERVIRRQRSAIQVLRAQEEERRRISRELHDQVGHALTGININLAILGRDGAIAGSAALKKRVGDTAELLGEATARVHNFARELRPAMLEELGLIPALRSYTKEYAERTGLLVQFRAGDDVEQLSAEEKTALFRVAQESLTNVAKHARASRVDVTLRSTRRGVNLYIKDDGRGCQANKPRAGRKKRLGLLGMQERMRMVNGRFTFKSAPGRGTTVGVRIPLKDGMRAAASGPASVDGDKSQPL